MVDNVDDAKRQCDKTATLHWQYRPLVENFRLRHVITPVCLLQYVKCTVELNFHSIIVNFYNKTVNFYYKSSW